MSMAAAERLDPGISDESESSYGYRTSADHLDDELRRLDIRLNLASLRRRLAGAPTSQSDGRLDEPPLLDALADLDGQIERRRSASVSRGTILALAHLARLFRLNAIEEQVLLICFAPEADSRYGVAYAELQGPSAGQYPSVALLLELLGHDRATRFAARAALSTQAPLLTYRLLQPADAAAAITSLEMASFVRIDPRVAGFLLGFGGIDDRLVPYSVLRETHAMQPSPLAGNSARVNRMAAFISGHLVASNTPAPLVFHLQGPDTGAARASVTHVCRGLALNLLTVDMEKIAAPGATTADLFWLIGREAVLQPAALCLDNFDSWAQERDRTDAQRAALFAALRHFSQVTFLVSRSAWHPGRLGKDLLYLSVDYPAPDIGMRRSLWQAEAAARGMAVSMDIGQLAGRYRFDAEQIADVLDVAAGIAYWRDPVGRTVTADDISAACRTQIAPQVGSLAQKRIPKYSWADLVLPPDPLCQLQELCNQAKHRHIVYGDWGFDRRLSLGNGLNAMFNGPPGTGKTMAADVIANDLQVELYRIDLSQIVSKYIGETEKNLDRVFREAFSSSAIIFFDEADALFGKRSEVKDAHDRYANIETGYLLQKMEEHEGLVILATNLRNNLDEAFLRRMHFVVDFPFPDEQHRARLWQGLFPGEVPRSPDVDFSYLARHFKLPGGNIRNIAVCAAFLAAADHTDVGMSHLARATRREYQKLGWPCTAADFGPYYELIKAQNG